MIWYNFYRNVGENSREKGFDMNKKILLCLFVSIQALMLADEQNSLPISTQRDICLDFLNNNLSFRGVPMAAWSWDTRQAVGQEIANLCVNDGKEAMALYLKREEQGWMTRWSLAKAMFNIRFRDMEYRKKHVHGPGDELDRAVDKIICLWELLHEDRVKQMFKRDEATKYTFLS